MSSRSLRLAARVSRSNVACDRLLAAQGAPPRLPGETHAERTARVHASTIRRLQVEAAEEARAEARAAGLDEYLVEAAASAASRQVVGLPLFPVENVFASNWRGGA